MLETPLYGRFQGEGRRLVFGPPLIYLHLVKACAAVGGGMVLYGFYAMATGEAVAAYPAWWVMIGLLVAGAAGLAAASLQSITFDLRERVYTRRQGPGMFPRVTRGPISNVDAIVAISEPNQRLQAAGVTYHLVLHWKGQMEPLMVLQQDTRQMVSGQPMNVAAAQLVSQGAAYAKAMGIPFYDNTQFASKCPISIWT
ncbi:MAG TPA: hypothetical protein VK934_13735 [Fimbriimonas sp.]|nr:hypothetical protein [Fimbriimonas sp.]